MEYKNLEREYKNLSAEKRNTCESETEFIKEISYALSQHTESQNKECKNRKKKALRKRILIVVSGFFCPLIWIICFLGKIFSVSKPFVDTYVSGNEYLRKIKNSGDTGNSIQNKNSVSNDESGVSGALKEFVFADGNGNYIVSGNCFYDWNGNVCEWGKTFYDSRGNYIAWGSPFYDNRDNYISWGEPFYDCKNNYVIPH